MEIVIRKLQEQRGEIALELGYGLLFSVLILIVLLNIRHGYQTIDRVSERTNEAVLAVAAANGPRALGGTREGEAVVRKYNGSSWERLVTSAEVQDALQKSLGASRVGESLVREGSFRIDNLTTVCSNADGGKLNFVTTLQITLYLMGGDRMAISLPLEVKTTYEAKF